MEFIYSGFEAMPRDEASRFPMSTRAATYILVRNRTCLCQNDTQWLPERLWTSRRVGGAARPRIVATTLWRQFGASGSSSHWLARSSASLRSLVSNRPGFALQILTGCGGEEGRGSVIGVRTQSNALQNEPRRTRVCAPEPIRRKGACGVAKCKIFSGDPKLA